MSVDTFQLQSQLNDLNEAIYSGVLESKDADGKMIQYRNMDDMMRAKKSLENLLGAATGKKRRGRGMAIRTCRGIN